MREKKDNLTTQHAYGEVWTNLALELSSFYAVGFSDSDAPSLFINGFYTTSSERF